MNPIRRRRLVALSIGLLGLGIAAGLVATRQLEQRHGEGRGNLARMGHERKRPAQQSHHRRDVKAHRRRHVVQLSQQLDLLGEDSQLFLTLTQCGVIERQI